MAGSAMGQGQPGQAPQGGYAPLAPQGNFNVNQAAAGGLQQAAQGTQQAMSQGRQGQAPQGDFNVNQAVAGGLQRAAQGTHQALGLMQQGQAPQGDFNVNQAVAGGPQPAVQGTHQALGLMQQGQALQGGYAPLAPQGDFNVNQAAAGGLQQAMQGTQKAMAGPNIGQFANPYTQMVTGSALNDLERQRQMTANTTGAQASAAGAFGGSRHGVADALTNEAYARQGAQTFGNLQQQGFNTALNAAQNQQNIQMGGAAQLGQLGNQAFNTGQTIQQNQAHQGLMQQGLNQALIDVARGQYTGYTGAPMGSLSAPLAALGATPSQSTTTKSKNPGLFDYLSLGATMAGGRA